MTTIDDRVTVAERYANATQTGRLMPPSVERRSDADVLLAAGIAASGDPKRKLALAIYRMGATGDTTSLWSVVEECDGWMTGYLTRKGRRPMPKHARRELIKAVLETYMKPNCGYCNGTGVTAEEDQGRKVNQPCSGCGGTGKRPLAREVPRAHIPAAHWLMLQINQRAESIFKEMAKRLSNQGLDVK